MNCSNFLQRYLLLHLRQTDEGKDCRNETSLQSSRSPCSYRRASFFLNIKVGALPHNYGRVWQSSSSAKPALELLLHHRAALARSWALIVELEKCVWQNNSSSSRNRGFDQIFLFCPWFFCLLFFSCCACTSA